MSPTLIIGLELTLVFGGVLGLAVFDLLRMRRTIGRGEREGEPARPTDPTITPEPSG